MHGKLFPVAPQVQDVAARPEPVDLRAGVGASTTVQVALAASTAGLLASKTSTLACEASECGQITMPLGPTVNVRPVLNCMLCLACLQSNMSVWVRTRSFHNV